MGWARSVSHFVHRPKHDSHRLLGTSVWKACHWGPSACPTLFPLHPSAHLPSALPHQLGFPRVGARLGGCHLPCHVFSRPRLHRQASPPSSPRTSARGLRGAAARPAHTAGHCQQGLVEATLKKVTEEGAGTRLAVLMARWQVQAQPSSGCCSPEGPCRCLGLRFHAGAGAWTSRGSCPGRRRGRTGLSRTWPR